MDLVNIIDFVCISLTVNLSFDNLIKRKFKIIVCTKNYLQFLLKLG